MEMIKISPQCIPCILNKYLEKFPENISDEQKLSFMRGVLRIIAENDNTVSAPEITSMISEYKNKMFGFSDDFSEVKEYYNRLMLSFEDYYTAAIKDSEKPLYTALKFAMLGNYIDFGALDTVEDERLRSIPEDAEKLNLDSAELDSLFEELKHAKSLVYLTDNCGEIVMDKLFINEIKSAFPELSVAVIVKGSPVLNDATMEDALSVGLDKVTAVLHNGSSIAGTALKKISAEAASIIDSADLIIAKGQANFETLCGCKKNIYYLFLCKCTLYSKRFNVPRFTGLLLKEI